MKQRIQKIISNRGYCSRRTAEQLIIDGKVQVNGRPVTIGDSAEETDKITIEGKAIEKESEKIYVALNKPVGYETTMKTTARHRTVMKLVRISKRVYPIGRLDEDSHGLLLLTNDGEFANKIMHPRYEIDKIYTVKVKGKIPLSKIKILEKGIQLNEFKTYPCEIKIIKQTSQVSILSMKIHEGRNRQIRRMIKAVGFEVMDLERSRIGNITIGRLKPGEWRYLNKKDLEKLNEILKNNKKKRPVVRRKSQEEKPKQNYREKNENRKKEWKKRDTSRPRKDKKPPFKKSSGDDQTFDMKKAKDNFKPREWKKEKTTRSRDKDNKKPSYKKRNYKDDNKPFNMEKARAGPNREERKRLRKRGSKRNRFSLKSSK